MYRDVRHSDQDIVRKLLKALLKAGYAINVNNGGEEKELSAPTADFKLAWGIVGEADRDEIYVYPLAGEKSRRPFGWIHLVYGNGPGELISDYSVSLEDVLKPVNAFAESVASR